MDSFIRRLKYYGIGFGIGLIFVLFFFQNRGCSWLPSNRVKNSVLDRVLVVSDDEKALLDKMNISKKDIIDVLNSGEVVFNKSEKKANPQVYLMQYEIKGKTVDFYFTLPKESFVSELKVSPKSATKAKNSTEGFGTVLRFPNDEHLLFVDSSKVLNCQQVELGMINADVMFKEWKNSARIDFSKSDLNKKPKPEHYFEFRDQKGRWIGTRSVWYKTKVNISHMDLPFETDCE